MPPWQLATHSEGAAAQWSRELARTDSGGSLTEVTALQRAPHSWNLRTHPVASARARKVSSALHGWVYRNRVGRIEAWEFTASLNAGAGRTTPTAKSGLAPWAGGRPCCSGVRLRPVWEKAMHQP